jgi:phosphate transporter
MHSVVEQAYPFQQETKDSLNDAISRLVALYAKCVTREDVAAAVRQLKVFQREQIAWERDTVWRTMIGQERRGARDGQLKALGGHVAGEEGPSLDVPTPIGRFKLTAKHGFFLTAAVVFVILLNVRILRSVEANNCFAVLVLATILWATEACSQVN